ncbi:hypothetical protein Z949_2271 [Sulfitobacter guttiformis KCTC 32187]|nr:hypothetical protein Z949_2271 [Sulfitobacter guttiformis KCTC 32187]
MLALCIIRQSFSGKIIKPVDHVDVRSAVTDAFFQIHL